MARRKGFRRYQALDFNGAILATGQRIQDVAAMGERVIVDNFKHLYAVQGTYPQTRHDWKKWDDLGDKLRAGLRRMGKGGRNG